MRSISKLVGITLVLIVLIVPAYADAVFMLGNHPQPDEQNILFTSDQMGSTVSGFTNQSNTEVLFSSTTDILVVTAGGQAKVTAEDGLINDLTITVPGYYFKDFILNPFKPAVDNDLQVSVTMSDGTIFNFGPYGDTNGDNFLTLLSGETCVKLV